MLVASSCMRNYIPNTYTGTSGQLATSTHVLHRYTTKFGINFTQIKMCHKFNCVYAHQLCIAMARVDWWDWFVVFTHSNLRHCATIEWH